MDNWLNRALETGQIENWGNGTLVKWTNGALIAGCTIVPILQFPNYPINEFSISLFNESTNYPINHLTN